jgi:hypothetical protein
MEPYLNSREGKGVVFPGVFEIMEPITVLRHSTPLRHRPGLQAGESGALQKPTGEVLASHRTLRGWWRINNLILVTFFICKDSMERTGTMNRSVRVQPSNTSLRRLRPQPTGRAAEVPPNSICLDSLVPNQRLLRMCCACAGNLVHGAREWIIE